MAGKTVDERLRYVPMKTLGRSGYIEEPGDRFAIRIEQLDALLCLMSNATDDGGCSIQELSGAIQKVVLELASSLATDIHELHELLLLEAPSNHAQRAGARCAACAEVSHG